MVKRGTAWQAVLAGPLAMLLGGPAGAEVVTDGTVGTRGRVTLSGPDVRITPDLGTRQGGNLFHSFQRFGVPAGTAVTFEGPAGIANVIGRVTGGSVSQIDGRLASTVPGAAVFLINPSGVVVGRTATIDVPGSLHLSTADELRFQDGKAYSATAPQGSTLTSAAPSSFGFLGQKIGKLSVQAPQLALVPGNGLSLVGGEVQVDGTQAEIVGPVLLASQQSAGDVPITATGAAVPRDGRVVVTNGAFFNVGLPAGQVFRVETGSFTLDQANIGVGAATVAGTPEADRTGLIIAAKSIDLHGNGQGTGLVAGFGVAGGSGPVVGLVADTIVLDGSYVLSVGLEGGTGGRVAVLGRDVTLTNGSLVGSPSDANGQLEISGAGGRTVIQASDRLIIASGSQVNSFTTTDQPAGDVVIQAKDVTLDDGQVSVGNLRGAGKAGTATIVASGTLALHHESSISAFTANALDGGTITIQAGRVVLAEGSQLLTSTLNKGRSGTLAITAGSVEMSGDSGIQASSIGSGNAGNVVLAVKGDVRLDHATIATGAASSSGGLLLLGVGGRLILQNGAQVATTILGATPTQRAGAVIVTGANGTDASRAVVLDATSKIVSNAPNVGDGGVIIIRTDALIAPIGGISASARQGNSGTVATNTPETDITSSFAGLGTEIDPNRQILASSCDARAITSSLTVGAVQTTERKPARHPAGCKPAR